MSRASLPDVVAQAKESRSPPHSYMTSSPSTQPLSGKQGLCRNRVVGEQAVEVVLVVEAVVQPHCVPEKLAVGSDRADDLFHDGVLLMPWAIAWRMNRFCNRGSS